MTRVVVAGGGIAGVEALLALREIAGDALDLTLVSPEGALRRQRLPSDGAPLGAVEAVPVEQVARALGADHVEGWLTGADPERRTAHVRHRDDVPYDALVVATGAERVLSFDLATVQYGGRLDTGAAASVLEHAREGLYARLAVVVPPGSAWPLPGYEVALRAAAVRPAPDRPAVTVVTHEQRPGQALGAEAAASVAEALEQAGVHVLAGTIAEDVDPGEVSLLGGGSVAFDGLVVLPYLRGPRLEGLPHDTEGFLVVDAHGRVRDVDGVFAAGDVTSRTPRQGGLAAEQGAAVATAVAASLGLDVEPEEPAAVLRAVLPAGDEVLLLEHDRAAGRSTARRVPPREAAERVAGVRLPAFLDRLAAGRREA